MKIPYIVENKINYDFILFSICMGYTIEISFDIRKHRSFSRFTDRIISLAEAKNCCSYYTLHEMEGGLAVDRNHCVITLTFSESNDCIEFIKLIKPIKKLYIECIYTSTPRFKIIYVSSYYFAKKMNKEGKQVYKKTTCSEEEEAIRNATIVSKKSISK